MTGTVPPEMLLLLGEHNPHDVLALRSSVRKKYPGARGLDGFLEVTADYYAFIAQLHSGKSSIDYTGLARTLEMGRDGLDVVIQTALEGDFSLKKTLAMLLTVGTNFLANTSYIQASMENAEGVIRAQQVKLEDHCWELARLAGREKEGAEGLDAFFSGAFGEGTDLKSRVALTVYLYRLLCVTHLARIVQSA